MQGEGAAAAWFAYQRDGAAVRLDRAAHEAQSQPRTGRLRLHGGASAEERLENLALLFRFDAGAPIFHGHLHLLFRRRVSGGHSNPATGRRVFLRVAEQVVDGGAKEFGVARKWREILAD